MKRPTKITTGYTYEEVRRSLSEVRILLTSGDENPDDGRALEMIEEYVLSGETAHLHSHEENLALIDRLFLSLRREMDILQPYVEDRSITEIMVNGKDDIFIERNGRLERLELAFDTTEDLEELIMRIAARVHREINELNPIVDARLSDGSRVNAVYRNVAINGPILTIRKFPDKVMDMEDLLERGSITPEAADLLQMLVRAGCNCFISGGTSSDETFFHTQ